MAEINTNLRKSYNKVIRQENLYFFLSISGYRELGFRVYKNKFFCSNEACDRFGDILMIFYKN